MLKFKHVSYLSFATSDATDNVCLDPGRGLVPRIGGELALINPELQQTLCVSPVPVSEVHVVLCDDSLVDK